MPHSTVRRLLAIVLLTAVYFAAGRLGLSLAFVNDSASAVWPPTGIAIAAVLVLGTRIWPGIAAGAFLVNLTTSGALVPSAAIAAGNTLEGLAGAWLARRFARGPAAFDRPGDVLRFAGLAGGVATAISASSGVAALIFAGRADVSEAGSIWFTWWIGDAVGALVVTPLLVLCSRASRVDWTRTRAVEAAALAAAVLVTSVVVFGPSPAGVHTYPLQFVVAPVLLWSAFRFGGRETATAAAVVSAVAIAGTLHGFGPFARESPNEALLLLQAFIGVTTIVMLAVAAEVDVRRSAEIQVRSLNDALERRVAERTEQLSTAHARLLEAQQVAHVGSWEWDVTTNALWWSEELYRIYGTSPGEVPAYEAFLARVHPEDRSRVDATVRQAISDGQPFTFDHRIVRPDGTIRILHAEGRIVLGSDRRTVRMMGIGHDITERRRAEEARAQLFREQAARQEAEDTNRAKDHFLAMLSHELRTPLNAALGWAHLLRELAAGDMRITRAAELIARNLLVQARLVSDILDVSFIVRGSLPMETEPVDLPGVVEASIDTVREAAEARQITIDAHVPITPLMLVGDARRLQQVLWNILSNAVKFGRDGGHIRVEVTEASGAITITVADNGPGINPAFLPHVFERFRQEDSSPVRGHGGLGLGLAIARHIVERHGGTIDAVNAPTGGCVFTVRLPTEASPAVV